MAGLVLSGALMWPQLSPAGQWRITPSVNVTEVFSDNASLAAETEDRNSDLITVFGPGLSVAGRGGRINLNFDYNLNKTIYLHNTNSDSLRNSLLGGGQVELWDRVLFLQGQASISRQIVDGQQRSSNSVVGQDINSATVRTVNLMPEFRQHIGNWADTRTTMNVSQTNTTDPTVQDTFIVTERFRADSGRRFTVILWSLDVNNSKAATNDSRPAERRRNVDGTLTYVYSPRLSLLGGLGWEQVHTGALSNQPKGLTWQIGFDARPGRLTTIGMTFGDRDGQRSFNARASHQFSQKISVNARYTETLQTTGQLLSQNLSNLITDPSTGIFINQNTGQPFVPGDPTFGLENNAFRQRRMAIGWSGAHRRTTYSGDVFYEEREFEQQNRNEVGYGIGFSLGRQHTPRLSSGLHLNYRHLNPDQIPNTVENEGSVGTSLSYQVSKTVTALLAYNFTMRRVDNSKDDYHENSVSISLKKTF